LSETAVRVGDIEITPVVASRFRLDGGSMFGVIPKVLWQKKAPADELNRIDLAVNSLVVRTAGSIILVEPGMGSKYDERQRGIYALEPLDMEKALARAGVTADQVDLVVPSHLHLDHAGGATGTGPSGDVEIEFPNARVVVQEDEWAAASAPGPLEKGSYNADDYIPLMRAGALVLVSGDAEVAPGVTVELTGGHTRGHQVVRFRSGGDEALFLGDIAPTTAHLKLNWLMAWDLEPEVTYRQKERLLTDAASRGITCFFAHDPAIAGCILKQSGRGSFEVIEDSVIEAV